MAPIDTDAPQAGSQAIDPYAETVPSMDAVIYTNKEYTVQDVDLSASTALSGWDEDTNRYLKVSLQGLDPTASYRLVLYTDPAIYATTLDFTNQTWDEHQQTENHSKISVNKGGTYTPNIHSGTTTYTITTGGKIEIYRGDELYRTLSDISIEMVRSGINIIEYDKVSASSRRNKASLGDLGKIQYLDLFAAVNAGTNDSGPVTVHAEFDSNKKKAIGVTAMRLMAPKGSTLTIHYTMIDGEGTLHECPAPLTVKSTSGDNTGYLFTRANLPAPFNTYHFKTITYVTTFPAGVQLFDSDSLQSPDSGGTVWGEVLVSTVPSAANRSKNSFYVYDGDFLGKEFDSSKLLVSATRAVVIQGAAIANQTASYGIYTPRVSLPGKSAGKSVELTPGDAAVITAQVKVAEYPYTARSAVKNLRIGVRLPLGVTINRADLSMTLANGTAVGIENISYTP